MATSSPSALVEHISCAVCLEVLRNPHALGCLHTYCHQCIQQLKQGDQVTCPDCRKVTDITEIKQDFKIQSLIDLHKKSVESTKTKSPTAIVCDICNVCKNTGKSVQSFCTNCEEFLCADCSTAHQGSKASNSHTLTSFDEICKSRQEEIEEKIQKVDKEIASISNQCNSNDELIIHIRENQVHQKAEVNRFRASIHQEVDQHHDHLLQEVDSISDNLISSLETRKDVFEKSKTYLQERISSLPRMSQSNDYSLLMDILAMLKGDIEGEVNQIRSRLTQLRRDLVVPLSVKKGKDWNPRTSTKIRVAEATSITLQQNPPGSTRERVTEGALTTRQQTSHTSTKIKVAEAPLTSKQQSPSTSEDDVQSVTRRSLKLPHSVRPRNQRIHQRYRQVQSVDLPCKPEKLCVTEEGLWVAGGDKGISLYTANGEQVKQIKCDQFKCVTSLVQTSTGDLIVGDRHTGLHRLNQEGRYLNRICEGEFSDVGVLTDTLYASEHKKRKVYVCKKFAAGSWEKATEFELCHTSGPWCGTLGVSSTTLYVCSQYNHSVDEYTLRGEAQGQIGVQTWGEIGNFTLPRLSDVDSMGRVLLCDCWNDRLQVFDPVRRTWGELSLLEGVSMPWCAGVGLRHIWVGTMWPNKLLKYEQVSE